MLACGTNRYATKYATKQEKGSKAFEKLVALAINGGGRAEPEVANRPAKGAFASYLVQQAGGRDWSAQEVAHVAMGIPTVIGSHKFVEVSVSNQSKLQDELDADAPDDAIADTKNLQRIGWTSTLAACRPKTWWSVEADGRQHSIKLV